MISFLVPLLFAWIRAIALDKSSNPSWAFGPCLILAINWSRPPRAYWLASFISIPSSAAFSILSSAVVPLSKKPLLKALLSNLLPTWFSKPWATVPMAPPIPPATHLPSPPAFLTPVSNLSTLLSPNLPKKPFCWPVPNILSVAALARFLTSPAIFLPSGLIVLAIGLKMSSLNHLPILFLISSIDALNGSVICLLIISARPPRRTPFLSFEPSIIRLKLSVVDKIPRPAPRIALPIKPNGPKNMVPRVATPIFGRAFFILAFLSLLSKPPSSPKRKLYVFSLFLIKDNPAPIIIPPNGPNGVIKPANAPVIPYFFASGAYLSTACNTFFDIKPESSLSPVLFPFASTNSLPNR